MVNADTNTNAEKYTSNSSMVVGRIVVLQRRRVGLGVLRADWKALVIFEKIMVG